MARLMRFYAMSWPDLMQLPIRAFWMLSGQIVRVRGEEQLEAIELHLISNQGITEEMIAGYRTALKDRVGNTAVFRDVEAPDTHANGIAELARALGASL